MKAPVDKPTVRLIGQDGNAFSILGAVKRELRKAKADQEYIDKFLKEAMSADYDNLLRVVMEYVEVEQKGDTTMKKGMVMNYRNNKGTGRVLPCTCTHVFQDKLYGKGKRVHNPKTGIGKTVNYVCSVCGKVKGQNTGLLFIRGDLFPNT